MIEMKTLTIDGNTYEIVDETARNSIPTKTSDLENNSGFITAEDIPEGGNVDLTDYYTKQEIDNKGFITSEKTDELSNEIAVERERINTFTTLPEGSTTADAELTDIRVGYNGTVYPNAGEAVRNQVSDIDNNLGWKITPVWIDGVYCKYKDGIQGNSANYACTDYIPVNEGKMLVKTALASSATGIVFFSATKEYISGIAPVTNSELVEYDINVPPNARYMRCNSLLSKKDQCVIQVADIVKRLNNVKNSSDIVYSLSYLTWLDKKVRDYYEDDIVDNENIILCDEFLPIDEYTSGGSFTILNNLPLDKILEVTVCFYDENKNRLGTRTPWFSSIQAVESGSVYFNIALRIKNSDGTYMVGIADELPLGEIYFAYNKATDAYLGFLQNRVTENKNNVDFLKGSYIDPETNILVEDIADLNTLGISSSYNDYYSRRPFNIVHCTDLHSSNNNIKCFSNAIKLLEKVNVLDCMVLTGDLVSSQFTSSNDALEAEWDKITKDVIFTVGNHDVGNDSLIANAGSDLQVYNKYYLPHLKQHCMYDESTTLSLFNELNASENLMMNYYVDYDESKIRIISMYQYNSDMEVSESDSTKLAYSRCHVAYKQSDIDWLINTLNNTPEDYTILFITHEPENFGEKVNDWQSTIMVNTKKWNKNGIINNILTAYKKKESYTDNISQSGGIVTTLNINADFSNSKGFFGAWILGHTHDDYVGKSLNGELNIICKTCDNLHAQLSSSILRTAGTPNENTINVVSVDTEHRIITVKRIGAKFSRNGDWRNVTSLTY